VAAAALLVATQPSGAFVEEVVLAPTPGVLWPGHPRGRRPLAAVDRWGI